MGEIRKLTFLGDITCDRPLLEACRISRGGVQLLQDILSGKAVPCILGFCLRQF